MELPSTHSPRHPHPLSQSSYNPGIFPNPLLGPPWCPHHLRAQFCDKRPEEKHQLAFLFTTNLADSGRKWIGKLSYAHNIEDSLKVQAQQRPCCADHKGHVTRKEVPCKYPSTVRDDLQPSLHICLPSFHLFTCTSLSEDSKPWEIMYWLAELRSQLACRPGTGKWKFWLVCVRPIPKRKSGGMDAGQSILTNTHGKETGFGSKRDLRQIKLSVLGQIPGLDTAGIAQGWIKVGKYLDLWT